MITGRNPFAREYSQSTVYAISFEPPEPLSRYKSNVPPELQRIVTKGLGKDVEHRYQHISDLRADLTRLRDDKKNWSSPQVAINQGRTDSVVNMDIISGIDQVDTSRLSWSQKIGVFLAGSSVVSPTRKTILWSIGIALVLLAGGITVVSLLLGQVDQERQKAEFATQKAIKGQQFLSDILTSSFPYGYGDKTTVLDILDVSSEKLNRAFPDDPDIESELRQSLGNAYLRIGHYEQAEREFATALELARNVFGDTHESVLQILHRLSSIHRIIGDNSKLLEDTRAVYAALTRLHGDSHVKSLGAKSELAYVLEVSGNVSSAIQYAKDAWETLSVQLGSDSALTIEVQSQYAWLLLQTGRVDKAEELARDALENSLRLQSASGYAERLARSSLAAVFIVQNEFDSAKALFGARQAPDNFGIERSFQGEFDLKSDRFQLLVFFETWCPYSRLAMTNLAVASRQYDQYGLSVMGLTRVNRSAVEEEVNDYLDELGVKFGVFKDNGRSWNYFGCTGTPSIRLLFDGYVIWEGSPPSEKIITPQMLEALAAVH